MRKSKSLIVATCVIGLAGNACLAGATEPQQTTQVPAPAQAPAAQGPQLSLKLSPATAAQPDTTPAFAPDTALLPSGIPQAKLPDEDATVLSMEEVDVWGRIRGGYAIPDLENELVTQQVKWYAARPDYIQRTTKRASRYLFHVVQELEKRNMPTELALLPFIESAFNPQAFSSASAVGLWQFMPATGRDYQLKQTMFKDERRSVLASTDAALTHLQRLYGLFNDWQLVLAAYNWGEGNVARIIKKAQAEGRPTDYNSLSAYMPPETRNYVPKLQAVKQIVTTPDLYGINLSKVENQPYFVTVQKTKDIDVKVAAQLAELPLDEFKALNPQFNRPVIIGGSKTQILLPQANAAKFKANLSTWTARLSSWTTHKISTAKERLETIAKKLGTSVALLREVNNIPAKMRLKAGSTILVPKTAATGDREIAPEVADSAVIALAPDVPDSRRILVRAGKRDTVAQIARRYKVSAAQVKEWNGLKGDTLAAGQKLRLNVPLKGVPTRLAKADDDAPRAQARTSSRAPRAKFAPSVKTAAKSSGVRKVSSPAPAKKLQSRKS